MDYSNLLNKEQCQAATCTEGAVMVSAGAGSGKTRLLTHRIAYLITDKGVMPWNFLAITFTNKAAGEMRERVNILAPGGDAVTVCTFHSLCARLLRQYISYLPEYNANFTIYSDSDRNKILKDVFAQLNIEDEETRDKLRFHFSNIKNENMPLDKYVQTYSYLQEMKKVYDGYRLYSQALIKNNAMDFDDLLVNCFRLLKDNPTVLESVQEKYKYIHVDEFQDTNKAQYDIVRLIANKYGNILVVGDEDQSIYGWRGANISNLFNFTKDFANCQVFKLEENYRSTKNIIEKANMLIKNNSQRLDKTLYTHNETGNDVFYESAYDEQSEADYVVRRILEMHRQGTSYGDMAILMRLNALSRPFEEKLLAYNVPHKIFGGFKFFERAEIKNAMSYFVAVCNPRDEQSLIRCINFPKRGIGAVSLDKMLAIVHNQNITLSEVIDNIDKYDLPSALVTKVIPLRDCLRELRANADSMPLGEFADYAIKRAGIKNAFDPKDKEDIDRLMHIDSLVQSIQEFDENNADATISNYVESITFMSDIDNDDGSESVTIATVHSAKGLEFDVVFVVGAEEKVFPIIRMGDENDMQEERRLMYVAVTRAKKQLFITSANSRYMYGKRDIQIPSRFLKEMQLIKPKKRVEVTEIFGKLNILQRAQAKPESQVRLARDKATIGAQVYHPHFGRGKIVDNASTMQNGTVSIAFDAFGVKVLSLDYAPITLVTE
ncbi:MAG: UvrD-helicase domain-containing protein [Clostridia bacterium]|nr:UvrD-helicase domain-containing protein [Clostridia bacterium]